MSFSLSQKSRIINFQIILNKKYDVWPKIINQEALFLWKIYLDQGEKDVFSKKS